MLEIHCLSQPAQQHLSAGSREASVFAWGCRSGKSPPVPDCSHSPLKLGLQSQEEGANKACDLELPYWGCCGQRKWSGKVWLPYMEFASLSFYSIFFPVFFFPSFKFKTQRLFFSLNHKQHWAFQILPVIQCMECKNLWICLFQTIYLKHCQLKSHICLKMFYALLSQTTFTIY